MIKKYASVKSVFPKFQFRTMVVKDMGISIERLARNKLI